MAIHASVKQPVAPPSAKNDLLASRGATPQNTITQQQEEALAQRESPAEGKHGEQQSTEHVEHAIETAALLTGGAILVAAIAIFAAGFMRRPIEQALRRLLYRIEAAELPLALPVTIAETIRELRDSSRIMSEMRADQDAA